MKKIVYLLALCVFLLAGVSPAVASPAADEPQPEPEAAAAAALLDQKTYLPLAVLQGPLFNVQGQVFSSVVAPNGLATTETPLADVQLYDEYGNYYGKTDNLGRFSVNVRSGRTLTPALAGYYFTPGALTVKQSTTSGSFSGTPAIAAAQALAPDAVAIPNPGFEYVPYYWNPVSGNSAGFTPFYTTARAHQGSWSGFTGVPYASTTFQESWSRWRTHEIVIPSGAGSSADVSFWIWPDSEEPGAVPAPPLEKITAAEAPEVPAELEALIGWDTEDPALPDVANDYQYIAVINPVTNHIVGYVFTMLRDDRTWLSAGPFSLMAFAGQTIKLEFGTVNDGDGYDSRAFFDDVYLFLNQGAVICTNEVLNPDFESTDWSMSWLYTPPQNVPPKPSDAYAWSGLWSGQAGTAPWETEFQYESTTEFYQSDLSIPANATHARLRMMVLPKSTGWSNWWAAETLAAVRAKPEAPSAADAALAPAQVESQYAYLDNPATLNPGDVLLFKYFSVDALNWLARSYDLLAYRNTTFNILFGVGDTDARKTSLFVDDVYLDVCVPAP